MKENKIEDRINNAYCFLNSMHSDFRTGLYYKEDLENLEHILSDYKRVLKENELLSKDIESWNKYYKEIEEEQIEMSNKNCELEFEVEELQKENEELEEIYRSEKKMKNEYIKLYQDLLLKENVIPTQNVKDRIEELNRKIDKSIDNSKGGLDEEFIEKAGKLLAQKRILQELLESEE